MKYNTCQNHKTPDQIEKEDHRSIYQKRCLLSIGDKIKATTEFRKVMIGSYRPKEPVFEGGKIIEFKDPYDSDGKTAHSLANVEMPCGCTHRINTAWLVKI